MPRNDIAFVDCETTGLVAGYHEIVEFAVVYPDNTAITSKVKPRFPERASPEALKVNGYNEAEWANAITQAEAASLMESTLKDRIIVGQNTKFDVGFIDAAAKEFKVKINTRYTLDLITLSFEHLSPLGIDGYSLKKVCEFLKVPPEPDVHRAVNGARACKMCWEQLVRAGPMRKLGWKFGNSKRSPSPSLS